MLELCWAPGLIMLYGSQACRKFARKIVSFSLASYALFFFIFLCFLAFSHLSGLPTNGGFLLGKVVFHLLLGSFCFRVENITQCLKYHQKCRTLISHLNWLQRTKFERSENWVSLTSKQICVVEVDRYGHLIYKTRLLRLNSFSLHSNLKLRSLQSI